MSLWHIIAGLTPLPALFWLFKWFLLATDVSVSYNWTQTRAGRPNFNRSQVAPMENVTSLQDCLGTQVFVRLQNGRTLKG